MREFKFRCWHDGYDGLAKQQMIYDERPGDCLTWLNQGQPIQVMQYTGLKDKNGTEIYEGDIVQGGLLDATGGFKISNDKTTVKFESGMFKAGDISLVSFNKRCEVVGNIYEGGKTQ